MSLEIIIVIFMILLADIIFIKIFLDKKLKKEREIYKLEAEKMKNEYQAYNEQLIASQQELEELYSQVEENENTLREIINMVPYPIFIMDENGNYLLGNQSLADFYNVSLKDIKMLNIMDRDENANDELKKIIISTNANVIKNKKKVEIPEGYIHDMDGNKRIFKITKLPFDFNKNEKCLLGIAIDITDIKEAEDEIMKKNNELKETLEKEKKIKERFVGLIKILSNFTDILNKSDEKVFSELLRTGIKMIGNDCGSVYIFKNEKWKFVDAVGHDLKILKSLDLKKEYVFKANEDIRLVDKIVETTHSLMPEYTFKRFVEASVPIKSTILCPLYVNNERIGGICFDVGINNEKVLTQEDFEIAKSLKVIAETFLTIKAYNNKVNQAYINFAQKLAMIAYQYDDETGSHISRIGNLAAYLAKKMSFEPEEVENIKNFASLHDIGKLFIPADILKKPGKLTAEEWEEMKKHTLFAEALLGNDEYFKTALEIAKYHHEKYNGEGYPYGLKGEEIPINAQILSMVDIYDALRSSRPYKKPYSHEEALKIISLGDGRTKPEHFNPIILGIFMKNSEEFRLLYEKESAE